ncbi:MAG: CopD family protein [Rhodospirillaceae bacterium]
MIALAVALHLIFALIWVGGMFFAVYVMRLAAGPLDPPERIALWDRGFKRFFPWVWLSIIALPLTGYYLIFEVYGGMANLPIPYHIMHMLGLVMILLFLHLWFAPYARFKKALDAEDIPSAGIQLNAIRIIVTVNLYIGIINSMIGASGRYW